MEINLVKIHKLTKNIFLFCIYKIVVITVQVYAKAGVRTIKVGNRELFWVEMIDVQ